MFSMDHLMYIYDVAFVDWFKNFNTLGHGLF